MDKVAFVVDSLIQFYRVQNAAKELIASGAEVAVFVPEDSGHNSSAADTLKAISEMGFSVFANAAKSETHYQVVLESYPLSDLPSMRGLKFDYRMKVPYFLLAAKPSSSYIPYLQEPYDAAFVFSKYEADTFQAYGRSHFVDPPNFANLRKARKVEGGRPKLLYLPTFNDKVSEDYEAMLRAFEPLRSRFHIVVKMHSATQYLDEEAAHRTALLRIGHEVLDQSADLASVLEEFDVVIAGNSAAVFDAIYAEVPVCVLSEDVNRFRMYGDTPLFSFVESGTIPQAKSFGELERAVDAALQLREEQLTLKSEQFTPPQGSESNLARVVLSYCAIPIAENTYVNLRRSFIQSFEAQIQAREDSLSWRLTAPLRWFLDKLRSVR